MSSRTDARAAARPGGAWLLAACALALAARAIGLNGGLWIDEVYSLVRSFRAPFAEILTDYWGDNHHPLYALLAHASRALLGESPWAIRLPAALLGVATVPALYALGRRVGNHRQALLAALLLAVNYHHVWFSQNARGYTALALATVLAMWSLSRGVETGRRRYVVLYGVTVALGAYTHLLMVFVSVGHALALLLHGALPGRPTDRRALWRGGVIAFGTGAAGTLLLYAPMLGDVLDYFLHTPSGLRGVSTRGWALGEAFRGLVLGLGVGKVLLGAAVVAAGTLVGAWGLRVLWRDDRFFVLQLLAPVAAIVAGAALARGTMYPRFFFFAIGPALLVAVRGGDAASAWVAAVLRRPAVARPAANAGIAVVGLLSAASLSYNYRFPKQDFEGAMRHVLAVRQPGDAVVSTGVPSDPYRSLYGQDWPRVATAEALAEVRRGAPRTWVLWTFPRYLEASAPGIAAVLTRECRERRVFPGTVGGGEVLACVLPAPAAGRPPAPPDSGRSP